MNVVVFVVGIPGAGKSTISAGLALALGSPVLSIGERLRELSARDPALADGLATGSLGPEQIVRSLVDDFLATNPVAVVDGFPRHREQALRVQELRGNVLVVHLALAQERAIERIQGREARMDDLSLRARVERDAAALDDVLEILAGKHVTVDAVAPVAEIVAALHKHLQRMSPVTESSTP